MEVPLDGMWVCLKEIKLKSCIVMSISCGIKWGYPWYPFNYQTTPTGHTVFFYIPWKYFEDLRSSRRWQCHTGTKIPPTAPEKESWPWPRLIPLKSCDPSFRHHLGIRFDQKRRKTCAVNSWLLGGFNPSQTSVSPKMDFTQDLKFKLDKKPKNHVSFKCCTFFSDKARLKLQAPDFRCSRKTHPVTPEVATVNKAIETRHIDSWFAYEKWCFSIVMLIYQRVVWPPRLKQGVVAPSGPSSSLSAPKKRGLTLAQKTRSRQDHGNIYSNQHVIQVGPVCSLQTIPSIQKSTYKSEYKQ